MTKTEIKEKALDARNSISDFQLEEKSNLIYNKLLLETRYTDAENILVYASVNSEVRTDRIIRHALENGKNVFCPKITDKKKRQMKFVQIKEIDELEECFFGIKEPVLKDDSIIFDKETARNKSLLIVPGVAFDRKRNRIGYGGGYYDRFMAEFSDIYKLALAYDTQIYEEELPAEPHDICLDRIITESWEL